MMNEAGKPNGSLIGSPNILVSAAIVTETKHPVSAAIVTSLLVLAEYSLCDIEHSIFDLFISECVQFQQ